MENPEDSFFFVVEAMRGSRKFCQRGSNTDFFMLLMGWKEDRNATKSGQSSARQRNATEMAFCWRTDIGPPLNGGLVAL